MKEIIFDTRPYPVPIQLRGYETEINGHESIYRILELGEVAIHKDDINRLKAKCNQYGKYLIQLGFDAVVLEEDKEAGE